MSTYSYGTPPTDATNLNSITAVLNQLPDNTSKQITPKDVRDAIYTAWENIMFKPTGLTSGAGYIGFDSGVNGLTQSKVYFGKRQASNMNVMNPTLLSSDTDFFFFNNKSDTGLQDTKISILAGTNSNILSLAPYFESKYVTGASFSYIDLNIVNNSTDSYGLYGGNINIGTNENKGYTAGGNVSINGMIFPSYIKSGSTASNNIDGYLLKYNNTGYLTWQAPGIATGVSASATASINGNPVLINGQETNFLTDATPVVQAIGSIPVGYTFSNENIVEVVRKIIYPYLSPQVSIVLNATPTVGSNPSSYSSSGTNNVVIELNNLNSFTYTYTITKRSNTITSVTGINLWSYPGVPIASSTYSTSVNSTSSADATTLGTKSFTMYVSDGTATASSSVTLNKVLPFFYGATTSVISSSAFNGTFAGGLTKIVKSKSNTTVSLSGNGVCIYFAYPSSHGALSQILDQNGFDVTSSFTYSTSVSINSPSGYWSSKNYYVYAYTAGGTGSTTTSVGMPPTYINPVNYQFNF